MPSSLFGRFDLFQNMFCVYVYICIGLWVPADNQEGGGFSRNEITCNSMLTDMVAGN